MGVFFEFGPDQLNTQKDLVKALHDAKPLIPIDYKSNDPIILVVNMSHIAVGFYLCQYTSNNCKQHCYNWFGSVTLNNCKASFSQPKLELYGLYRVL